VRDECCKLETRLESAAAELSKAAAVTSAAEAARRAVVGRCRALEAASARAEREAAAAAEGRRVAERNLAAEAALRVAAEGRSAEARSGAEAMQCQAADAMRAAEAAATERLKALEGEGATARVALYACVARAEAAEAALEREGERWRAAEGDAARAANEAVVSVEAAWREAAEWRRAAEERERAVCYLELELEQTQAQLAQLARDVDQVHGATASEDAGPAERAALCSLASKAFVSTGTIPAEGVPAPPLDLRRSPPPSALPLPRVLCSIAPNTAHDRRRAPASAKLRHAAPKPRGRELSEVRHDRDELRLQLGQVRQQAAALAAAAR
jgi:hypothetical protein